MQDELRSLLSAVRRRWVALVSARTVGRASAVAAAPLGAAFIVDRLVSPAGGASILLGIATAILCAGCVLAVVWRSRQRPGDHQLARFIEEQAGSGSGDPAIADALVSAVDTAALRQSGGFGHLVIAHAVARLRHIPPSSVIKPAALRRAILESAAGIAVFALAAVLAGAPLARAVENARYVFLPGTIHVSVAPGNTRVVAGRPLRIRASIRGGEAVLRRLGPTLTVSTGRAQRTVPMVRNGDGFEFAFESVDRSFRYRVGAGRARSDEYTVTTMFPPRVERIDARYVYPSFTGLAPRNERGAGDMYAPAGTRVHLRVHTDRPVASGALRFGESSPAPLRTTGDRLVEGDIVLSAEDSYRVTLADADGLTSDGDTEYFIRLLDDRPPNVRIMRPSADQAITPLEEVAIEARADDDYGIGRFELVYSVAGKGERVVAFRRVTGTDVEKLGAFVLAAEDLHVQPGDVITYYARARDVPRGKQATEVKSDIFFLEVKPFNQEFVSAESQAMAGASGPQIDALVASQKEIINATWNLERRTIAGRSPADLKAVADAQADLKRKAEQMAGGGPRRRPSGQPQQIRMPRAPSQGGQESGDPVGRAVEAMSRAVQQLEAQRTGDAIPHEMSALQALLRAQAEIRTRQVTRQQAGSGAGSGRQGEDLSALFDKELQRQQRTNYETRPQVEQQPERQDDASTTDRVKDLARRQEDLTRRQRQLATAGISDEERRRQLDRLTREQNQLREEAEQLAQRTGQQQGQSSASEMRAAAGELQRQDPEAAAERSERAAHQLRQLEQKMRAGSTGARQRAAGELQVEAQQIADGQRRISRETGRLGTGGTPAGSEARRRLAAEKERLADRLDELERSARQVAGELGKEPGGGGAADAARELEEQRLSQRMRETARAMRGEAAKGMPQEQASAEQQLSRAIDRVVDKLGGGTGSENRQLAEQLDQTRGTRERLDQLERKIRDAEARARDAASRGTPQGTSGRQGPQGAKGDAPEMELQALRDEYARELQRARRAFTPNGRGPQRSGIGTATPEQEEFSRSAPGTEAFKNDYSRWEQLRKDVDLGIEKYEAALSSRLVRKRAADRLSGGGSDRVPEGYGQVIARYYESLAQGKK